MCGRNGIPSDQKLAMALRPWYTKGALSAPEGASLSILSSVLAESLDLKWWLCNIQKQQTKSSMQKQTKAFAVSPMCMAILIKCLRSVRYCHFSHLQPIESFFLPIVCATHSVGHGGVTRISQSSFAREIIDIVIATTRHLIELNIYAFWQNWEVPPCNSAVHACSYEGFQLSFHLFGGLWGTHRVSNSWRKFGFYFFNWWHFRKEWNVCLMLQTSSFKHVKLSVLITAMAVPGCP